MCVVCVHVCFVCVRVRVRVCVCVWRVCVVCEVYMVWRVCACYVCNVVCACVNMCVCGYVRVRNDLNYTC